MELLIELTTISYIEPRSIVGEEKYPINLKWFLLKKIMSTQRIYIKQYQSILSTVHCPVTRNEAITQVI